MSIQFHATFALGAILLIAGFMLQWLPEATIAGMEKRLTDPNLSSERKNELQGALLSWDIWKLTTFNPLSITLIVAASYSYYTPFSTNRFH